VHQFYIANNIGVHSPQEEKKGSGKYCTWFNLETPKWFNSGHFPVNIYTSAHCPSMPPVHRASSMPTELSSVLIFWKAAECFMDMDINIVIETPTYHIHQVKPATTKEAQPNLLTPTIFNIF
jgi:hypothetical protein